MFPSPCGIPTWTEAPYPCNPNTAMRTSSWGQSLLFDLMPHVGSVYGSYVILAPSFFEKILQQSCGHFIPVIDQKHLSGYRRDSSAPAVPRGNPNIVQPPRYWWCPRETPSSAWFPAVERSDSGRTVLLLCMIAPVNHFSALLACRSRSVLPLLVLISKVGVVRRPPSFGKRTWPGDRDISIDLTPPQKLTVGAYRSISSSTVVCGRGRTLVPQRFLPTSSLHP